MKNRSKEEKRGLKEKDIRKEQKLRTVVKNRNEKHIEEQK